MSIDKETLAELRDARDKICDFCGETYEVCQKCQVKILVDKAFNECENEYDHELEVNIIG
jgi:hypothetical protein